MPWIYLDVPLTISLDGPLHVGTGYDWGLVQRSVARERIRMRDDKWRYDVYLPASTLKGRVRAACEELARLVRRETYGPDGAERRPGQPRLMCGAPRPEAMCGKQAKTLCLVCRIFGAPGGNVADERKLFWENASLSRESLAALSLGGGQSVGQTMSRTQVQLSRVRGVATEDRLFTSEFAAPGLTFKGRVSGWLDATPCSLSEGYYEVALLLAGLRLVETVGGGRSRGAGRCRITIPGELMLRPQGQEARRYQVADLLKVVGELEYFTEEAAG